MNRILNDALSLEKRSEGKVVIIKGNPDKMKGMERIADKYYADLAAYVKELGFTPEFDAGEPKTCPDKNAAFWIAHSRGVDRIRCIPESEQWRFLKFGDLDGIIHPKDAKWQKSITDHTDPSLRPPKEHFEFTQDQKDAIDRLRSKL